MKKLMVTLLSIVLIFSFSGCGKSQQVKDAESAINEIGNVSLESGRKIVAAERLYTQLSEKEREKVENRSKLFEARDTYDEYQQAYQQAENYTAKGDYFDAICIFAKYGWVDAIKQILGHLKYGEDACRVAILNEKLVTTLAWDEKLGEYWLHYYDFYDWGNYYTYDRSAVLCSYDDFESGSKACPWHDELEILYIFDIE